MSDIFLHTIHKGDSQDSNNKDAIEVTSFQMGAIMPVSDRRSGAGSGTVADVNISDIVFTKQMDKSSVPMLGESWMGKHFDKMLFKFYRSDGDNGRAVYMEAMIEFGVISGYSFSSGGELPFESISVNPGKITFKYAPTSNSTGGIEGGPIIVSYDAITKQNA
ncbi:MAG: type VI secretion system tube protein Hcp [Candidatus Kapabacteria bacterium]|nr:type VI secretion system tube protein Hcp [Candidatus Kapabacteria bacterium]